MAAAGALGIPQLDRLLPDVPSNSAVVLVNDPGVESEPFLYQCANAHLNRGHKVIYGVFNRPPSSVVDGMGEYGFAPGPGQDIHFLDAFSSLMGAQEAAAYTIDDPKDLEALAATLEKAAQDHPGAVLVLDSLSTLVDMVGPSVFIGHFPRLKKALEQFDLVVALLTRWPYTDDVSAVTDAFDAVVSLKGVESRVQFSQYFSVERARWIDRPPTNPQLYKTIKPGGVYVYIPKIVVTGPHNAGKSTFVQSVSDTSVSVDRLGTTVALDHGHATIDGLIADIFGTPGQARFDPIIRTVAGQALGVLVIVDSTNPDTFTRARELLDQTWRQGLPALVVANKQDVDGALTAEAVREQLRPPEGVEVTACVAQDREAARTVLHGLIDRILLGPPEEAAAQ